MIGRTRTGACPLQHDRKLFAHLLLADELRQAARPQTSLEGSFLRLGHRRDQAIGVHRLPHRGRSAASARRNSTATVSDAWSSPAAPAAPPGSLLSAPSVRTTASASSASRAV